MIRIGVIGYSYWGPNLVRNFTATPHAKVVALADARPEKLATASRLYPGLKTFADGVEMIRDAGVDAVAIATPVSTHYPLALEALRAGKHVFVEKPLAGRSSEAADLTEEANNRNLILLAYQTFVY